MQCPKCGFEQDDGASECVRCGVIFAKSQKSVGPRSSPPGADGVASAQSAVPEPWPTLTGEDVIEAGSLGRTELRILGIGLAAAVVVYAVPFLRFGFSVLVTLFHELGHAVASWLLGHPALPAFDFVYGGGFTHMDNFQLPLALVIAAGFAFLGWTVRGNRRTLVLVAALAALWLLAVSAAWRRELVVGVMGHGGEVLLAATFFYMALANVGFRIPEIERPLASFAAFFVVIHSLAFFYNLRNDADFLTWYLAGKGGALMNDLESVALDLNIHFGWNPGVEGLAGWFFALSFVPFGFALLLFFYRDRAQELLRSLLTVSE